MNDGTFFIAVDNDVAALAFFVIHMFEFRGGPDICGFIFITRRGMPYRIDRTHIDTGGIKGLHNETAAVDAKPRCTGCADDIIIPEIVVGPADHGFNTGSPTAGIVYTKW